MRLVADHGHAILEPALGLLPGRRGTQHLLRLVSRARALEVMLSADDYDAEFAERYGWINRAIPAYEIDNFVRTLAHRIAGFPGQGHAAVKDRVNAIALPPIEDFRRDSDMLGYGLRDKEAHIRIRAALERGFPTRDAEMALARMLGNLPDHRHQVTHCRFAILIWSATGPAVVAHAEIANAIAAAAQRPGDVRRRPA